MTSSFWYARYYQYLCFWFILTNNRMSLSYSTQTQRAAANYNRVVAPKYTNDPFGPPPQLKNLDVGQALSQPSPFSQQLQCDNFQVICLSKQPHLFLLRRFVPSPICHQIMSSVSSNQFTNADTTEGNERMILRHDCEVAWQDNEWGTPAFELGRTAGNVALSQGAKESNSAGCEPMQVLHYTQGGEFVLHHDGICRIVTVLYYLNGVAGTWFPFAGKRKFYQRRPRNREEALKLVEENHLQPGYDGVLLVGSNSSLRNCPNTVVVEAGDAVFFYNYHLSDDGKGIEEQDWFSLHAGLPTNEGDKWVANHWIHSPELFQNIQPQISRGEPHKDDR